jgi:hypothetical protein
MVGNPSLEQDRDREVGLRQVSGNFAVLYVYSVLMRVSGFIQMPDVSKVGPRLQAIPQECRATSYTKPASTKHASAPNVWSP